MTVFLRFESFRIVTKLKKKTFDSPSATVLTVPSKLSSQGPFAPDSSVASTVTRTMGSPSYKEPLWLAVVSENTKVPEIHLRPGGRGKEDSDPPRDRLDSSQTLPPRVTPVEEVRQTRPPWSGRGRRKSWTSRLPEHGTPEGVL